MLATLVAEYAQQPKRAVEVGKSLYRCREDLARRMRDEGISTIETLTHRCEYRPALSVQIDRIAVPYQSLVDSYEHCKEEHE